MNVEVRRYIIVGAHRIDITNCYWCNEWDKHICALCGEKAEQLRKTLKSDRNRAEKRS